METLPFAETIRTYQEDILQKAGELISGLSSLLVNSISSVTKSTVQLIFMFFIFLYSMFFFIKDGHVLLEKILYYLPLSDTDERRILEKFTSVTRATLKGTVIIGILQGGLAGLAFWVVGIKSAIFWGTLMTVLSIIPAVGSALVWIPAVIVLFTTGRYGAATGLLVWCGLVVGSLDNILRPRLVGKDTKMHELLILFGTLGGITLFGIVGFIIGPIISALFVTFWEIYGETFAYVLPKVNPIRREPSETSSEDQHHDEDVMEEDRGDEPNHNPQT